MRKLWMLLVAVALSAALPAQTGDADLLVLESSGKVKYFAPDGSKMRLESGMKIDPEGSLKLCPKAKVQVLQGIEVTTFDEKGRHSLTAELPEEPATSRFGFGGELEKIRDFSHGQCSVVFSNVCPTPSCLAPDRAAKPSTRRWPVNVKAG